MNNALLTKFINKHKRTDIPEFRPGDTIRVHVKIKEGDKERLQAFEGHADRPEQYRDGRDDHGAQSELQPRRGAHLSRCTPR